MAVVAGFQHESWTSRRAFLLATIGAAVGLGNLWRFPFIAGQNGGAGFVLLYLGFVFFLGLPVMIGEMILGRRGHQSAVGTMNLLVRHLRQEAGQRRARHAQRRTRLLRRPRLDPRGLPRLPVRTLHVEVRAVPGAGRMAAA